MPTCSYREAVSHRMKVRYIYAIRLTNWYDEWLYFWWP